MRALLFGLICLLPATSPLLAQGKTPPKAPAIPASETRYFTTLDGLLEGNADIILKEVRQGKTVTAATLDVCYPAEKGSERKDRFVVDLAVSGATMSGSTQTQIDKLPVSVKMTRKPTGDTFEFKGEVTIGRTTTQLVSTDNSDQSEKEFLESHSGDDVIAAAPKDFTEVSPEAVAVRVKLYAAVDFLKSLKGQNLAVSFASLNPNCEALRAGHQVINIAVDPDHAAALVARAKSAPGVVSAGWTSGMVDMERTIRFAAAEWRSGDKVNRDKLAMAVADVLSKTLNATLASSIWSDDSGKLTLTFKRPSPIMPALGLTETVEITALASPDRPGATDQMMLYVSTPTVTTADEANGAKLGLSDDSSREEETEPKSDNNSIDALAKEFKAQRWDADNSSWK
ncbi:hypothetical protein NP284_01550 [Rhodopseudomonas pseudopalustris]|uniref:hypothetical protein n=1 Tax=Rhodopseudomonas pseudopalustris TaxID=1513892 RepID=UPI003F9D5DAC